MEMLRVFKRQRVEAPAPPDGLARLADAVRGAHGVQGVISDMTVNVAVDDVQMTDVPADMRDGLRLVARALCMRLRGPTDHPVAGAKATVRPADVGGRYIVAASASFYAASVDVSAIGLAALVADPDWDVRHPTVRGTKDGGTPMITISVDVARAQ